MIEVENLSVSLTKNGYLKIAALAAAYPSHEILEHATGSIPGVNLVRSQVANILCADPQGIVPAFWDDIREHDRRTIKAFTFVAIVFSHHRLIQALLDSGRGGSVGTLVRSEMSEKEYTNLQFAMSEVGMCDYGRGTDQINYDIEPLRAQLRQVGHLVGELLRVKLRRCGWRDPDHVRSLPDAPLAEQCVRERFHEVFGLGPRQFSNWIMGRPTRPR